MRTTAPGQSALLLLDVISMLNERHIPYAVIGAFAASFYGVIRASVDADAVISIHGAQEAMNLCKDFQSQGFGVEYRRGEAGDPINAVINLRDSFYNRVDLLIGIQKMTEDVFGRTQQAQFMGASIKIISLEDFIALKIFAGGPKDIQDVMGVVRVSGQKINLDFLKQLTAGYGTDSIERLNLLLKQHPL